MIHTRHQRKVINPYRNLLSAGKESWNKIFWDITNASRISSRNLSSLKESVQRDKCVILCNGPSLLNVDFSSLDNVFTIGLNKINLLFDSCAFRPSVIVAVNPYVIAQNKSFYHTTDIHCFLDRISARKNGLKATSNRTLLFSSSGYPMFSCDPRVSICQGATVTYVAIQLAYFLGFSKVALVGCDHNFATKGPDHKLVASGETDPNHFDPRYFSGGDRWQLPSIAESEESYLRAKRFYEYDQRTIYNCTVGGKLELYSRISLENFLSMP